MTLGDLTVAVLAGGLGTRLAGVLPDRPKVLAPVGGRPFLDILLDTLAGQGIGRVVLCLGVRAEQVAVHLAGTPRHDLTVEMVTEDRPLGTAGAIALARPVLGPAPVMVMNGDTFVDADLGAFLSAHRAAGAAASLLCCRVDDMGRYGGLDIGDDGYVRRFREKQPDAGPGMINAGVYLLEAPVLDRIGALSTGSLERDVLECLPPGTLLAVPTGGRFIDIGTPDSLALAPSVISPALLP